MTRTTPDRDCPGPEDEPGYYELALHHALDPEPPEPDLEITPELVTLFRRLVIASIHQQPGDRKTLTRDIAALVRAAVAGHDARRAAARRTATNIHNVIDQFERMYGPLPGDEETINNDPPNNQP